MRKLTFILLLISQFAAGQTTYDTSFTKNYLGTNYTWRFRVTLPPNYTALYNNPANSFPAIIYIMALGEVGTDTSKIAVYGPHKFIRNGGKIFYKRADGDTLWPVVISVQPTAAYPVEPLQRVFIDDLITRYKIRKHTAMYATVYSHGGWSAKTFATGDAYGTYGTTSYAYYYTAIMDIAGMKPDDNSPYPNLFDNYALAGGKMYLAEQINDGRDQATQAARMNSAVPGSATHRIYSFGNGSHTCCTDYWFGGTSAPIDTFNILGKIGSIYSVALSLGDTTIPTVAAGAPVANAGPDQVIYMPQTSVTLNGSASTGVITSQTWTRIQYNTSRVLEGVITSPSSLTTTVTNLGIGTFAYELSVTDGSTTSKDTVVITAYGQKSPACNPGPYNSYTLTPSGGEIYTTDLTAAIPNLKGGDTIKVPGGNLTLLQLDNFSGDSCKRIEIVMLDTVRITRGSSPMIRINGGRYFNLRGAGKLLVNGILNAGNWEGQGISVIGASSDYTIDSITFKNCENGVYSKQAIDTTNSLKYAPNWEWRNAAYTHIKVDSTQGEGAYIGDTFFTWYTGYLPVRYVGLTISDWTVNNAGWDGIQTSNARNVLIKRCTVNVTGVKNVGSQQFGIILGGLSNGSIEDCVVKKSASSAYALFGYDTIRVKNSTADSCGYNNEGTAFSTIYINDNSVSGYGLPSPHLIYFLDDLCLTNVSSYAGGAAIKSANGSNSTRPGAITNVTVYDPLGRTSTNIIVTNESGTSRTGITLGQCVVLPPAPVFRGYPMRGRRIQFKIN